MLWRIAIFSGALEQERAGKKIREGGGEGFKRFRSHITPPSPVVRLTYKIHLIKGYISLHSCQILSPSETDFIVSAHRMTKITLLTPIATL